MIKYQPAKYKKIIGDYRAEIVDVRIEPNKFYKPEEDNSTENILDIDFVLDDPVTLEKIPFTERFVSPLVGGRGLFQQLMDIKEFLPETDGGEFDERNLIGLKMTLTIVENNKGYSKVSSAKPLQETKEIPKKKVTTPSVSTEPPEDGDLPF